MDAFRADRLDGSFLYGHGHLCLFQKTSGFHRPLQQHTWTTSTTSSCRQRLGIIARSWRYYIHIHVARNRFPRIGILFSADHRILIIRQQMKDFNNCAFPAFCHSNSYSMGRWKVTWPVFSFIVPGFLFYFSDSDDNVWWSKQMKVIGIGSTRAINVERKKKSSSSFIFLAVL